MIDVQDGRFQAYLDDELDAGQRAEVEALLERSAEARARLDSLRAANRRVREALAALDVAPPTAAARDSLERELERPARFARRSLVRAAGLVLLLAAGASAAVPGSPVRAWIASVLGGADAPEAAPLVDEPQPATPEAASPAGVSLRVGDRVDVSIRHEGPADLTIRLVPDDRLTITARDGAAAPAFRTARERVEMVGGHGGALELALPETLVHGRVELNGRLVAELRNGELTLVGAGQHTGDSAIVTVR